MGIQDKLVNPDDYNITQPDLNPQAAPSSDLQPTLSPMMRCPLPPIAVSPDSLRQFYRGGMLPQKRLFGPSNNKLSGSGGTTNVTVAGASENISVGPPPTPPLAVKQTAIVTASLGVGQTANAVVLLGKTFQIADITSNKPSRIELYGSSQARSIDSSRVIDTTPAAGVNNGIICDLVLDSSPLIWSFENLVGNNNDNPQNNVVYAAITNLGTGNTSIVVTIVYVPFVSA